MANPQPDQFTKLSNELLDALCSVRVPGEAMQILLFILRKTYGFNQKKDKISLKQFAEATGMPRPTCSRGIKKLGEMNLILISKKSYISEYSINKDYETWKVLSKKITVEDQKSVIKNDNSSLSKMITPVIKNDNKTVIKNDTHKRNKETIYKETIKDSSGAKAPSIKKPKKSPKGKPKKPKIKPPDFIDKIVDLFANKYSEVHGSDYIIQAKDKKAAGRILNRYKKFNQKNSIEKNSEETLKDFEHIFIRVLNVKDTWYFNNMTLTLLDSKANEINQITKGNNGKRIDQEGLNNLKKIIEARHNRQTGK